MNASSLVRSIFLAGLTTTLTLLVSGCSSCKPGKPGKIKAYHITVNLDESLKQSSVRNNRRLRLSIRVQR